MTLPASIGGREVVRAVRCGGGDINEGWRADLEGGTTAFVKTRGDPGEGEYRTEAAGLAWLADAGAHTPDVLEAAESHLALRWVDPGRMDAAGEETLGRTLALVHAAGAGRFGAAPPGAPQPGMRLGRLVLPNEPAADWPAFYADRRLRPLLRPAVERGALSGRGAAAVERVCDRLADLSGPPEPPARLHGDLWSGNVHAGADGTPYLIDPAAHGGHREIDLAMLDLFGSVAPRVLAAYEDVSPLAGGHEDRRALWQLFPLLVHAVLFGGGYGASAQRAAERYA